MDNHKCVKCNYNKKFNLGLIESMEVYYIIRKKLKLTKVVSFLILELLDYKPHLKIKYICDSRCLPCNKLCHLIYCHNNISEKGDDFCEYHKMRLLGILH